MPLKANDCHNHLKLKIKAQICYFLLFLPVFFAKIRFFPETAKQNPGKLSAGLNKPLYHKANSQICMIWLVGGFFVC
jgi:hypothetical protein